MFDFIGLSLAILAIILSFYWFKQQKKSTESTETTTSTLKGKANKEKDSKQQQPKEHEHSHKKNPKTKAQPAAAKKNRNRHQIPSDPRFLRRYGGHAGTVTAFSASPDGQWLATAGTDGQIRVAKVDEAGFDLSATVKTPETGVFQDHLSAISWLSSRDNNPTLVGTIVKSRQIAFYRIRHRKNAKMTSANNSSQYEVVELLKRRFDISNKVGENDRVSDVACLADQSHDSNIILTKTEYDPKRPQLKNPNTVAWGGDGRGHTAGSTVTINSPGIRISPDRAFLCGRGGIGAAEAKIFEIRRKKVKGESEPVFDSISSKSVMTLVPATTGAKVADVAFCGEHDNLKQHHTSLGIVACEDGSVEVWDLDVDYRQKEDARFICSARVFDGIKEDDGTDEKKIVCMAASIAVSSSNSNSKHDNDGAFYRVAVATSDSALHLLSYHIEKTNLSLDFSIVNSNHKEGVGELQFCPLSGNVLYSTGKNNSREVYSWKLS